MNKQSHRDTVLNTIREQTKVIKNPVVDANKSNHKNRHSGNFPVTKSRVNPNIS